MKLSYLIIGIVLFFMGVWIGTKLVIAAGIIFVILSLSESKEKVEEEKKKPGHKILTSKNTCSNCGAETLSDDNYCPECGKKVLP